MEHTQEGQEIVMRDDAPNPHGHTMNRYLVYIVVSVYHRCTDGDCVLEVRDPEDRRYFVRASHVHQWSRPDSVTRGSA